LKKLIALYTTPDDPEAFMAHYRAIHLPLVAKVPGLVRTELSLVTRTLVGKADNYLLAEMYFKDEHFRDALRSPENAALGQDLALFADGLVIVMTADIVEG